MTGLPTESPDSSTARVSPGVADSTSAEASRSWREHALASARTHSRHLLWFLALAASAALQFASASRPQLAVKSPNAADLYGASLARDGTYAADAWIRLKGPAAGQREPLLRAFHLPGEPAFLAACFLVVPEPLLRYIHVPVTVALVAGWALAAWRIGGPRASLFTLSLASLDPYIILHGPVYDDVFLGVALAWWTALAVLGSWPRAPFGRFLLCGSLAGAASGTRALSGWTLFAFGVLVVFCPKFRVFRKGGIAVLLGITLFTGAWSLRNWAILGRVVTGTTHDGITLWESTYPRALEALAFGQVEALNGRYMQEDYVRVRDFGEAESDSYYRNRAFHWMAQSPASVIAAGLAKAAVSLAGLRPELGLLCARNLVGLVAGTSLLVFGIAGAPRLVRCCSDARSSGLLAFFICTGMAEVLLLLLGPAGIRYRLGITGVLMVSLGIRCARLRAPQTRSRGG